jgi:hypothetical protein
VKHNAWGSERSLYYKKLTYIRPIIELPKEEEIEEQSAIIEVSQNEMKNEEEIV